MNLLIYIDYAPLSVFSGDTLISGTGSSLLADISVSEYYITDV